MQGILYIEHLEVKVVFRVVVELRVAHVTLDPFSIPGEFEKIVDDLGECVAEYAGDFDQMDQTCRHERDIVGGREERQAYRAWGPDKGEYRFGECHASNPNICPIVELAEYCVYH